MLSQLRTAASRTSPRTFALRAVRSYSSTGALARETGTVKFFNTQKGFGFVEPDAGGGDLFMHATGIRGAEVGKYHEVADETRVEALLARPPHVLPEEHGDEDRVRRAARACCVERSECGARRRGAALNDTAIQGSGA